MIENTHVDGESFLESVLPVYRPLFLRPEKQPDIWLLWGGRDAGKTHGLIQKAVWECMTADYFRCILIKKTYESIKDSQYQGIKDYLEDNHLDHLFEFRTSPITITCKKNGNKFIARGCDKPEKIRGVSNPSHAWYEEGNQLDEQDYINVSTSLRTTKARIQEWFSFNPEAKGDYENFWVYTYFFKGHDELNFTSNTTIEYEQNGRTEKVVLSYRSIHTTYNDNRFASPQQIARHENLKHTNPHYYRVFTLGLWGNEENDTPYFAPFSIGRHVNNNGLEIDDVEDLWFSFDFNLDPCTVVVGQKIRFLGCNVLDALQNSKGTRHLCHQIMDIDEYREHSGVIKVTGDNSGYSGSSVGGVNSVGESINDYLIILEVFNEYRPTFREDNFERPHKVNRTHALSRVLCNELLNSGYIQFDSEYAKPLIKDIQKAVPDVNTQKLFKNRQKGYEMDLVDAWRYLVNAWFPDQLNDLNIFINEIKERD